MIPRKQIRNNRLKKQSGGSGEFAHVMGRIEPCQQPFVFENRVVGGAIPKAFITACEKGCEDALTTGPVEGYPVMGIKVILEGGSYHAVDSSEYAFRTATQLAIKQAISQAKPYLLEPIMRVEVETPQEFVGRVQGDLSARRGLLLGSQTQFGDLIVQAEVPLVKMFGYSNQLRSLTSGMASFTMEFACYRPVQ